MCISVGCISRSVVFLDNSTCVSLMVVDNCQMVFQRVYRRVSSCPQNMSMPTKERPAHRGVL